MRRSREIRLTLLVAGGLSLSACGSKPDTDFVAPDIRACLERFGNGAADTCQETFSRADADHLRNAPRFQSREECRESTGGDCAPASQASGASPWGASSLTQTFIPVMAGVLIGRATASGERAATPVYSGLAPRGDCPEGQVQNSERSCVPRSSGSSGGGYHHWYSGGAYMGGSPAGTDGRMGRNMPVALSPLGTSNLNNIVSSPSSARSGSAAVAGRSGGFGASGASHGGGSSS